MCGDSEELTVELNVLTIAVVSRYISEPEKASLINQESAG